VQITGEVGGVNGLRPPGHTKPINFLKKYTRLPFSKRTKYKFYYNNLYYIVSESEDKPIIKNVYQRIEKHDARLV